jgi:hypothetical protein
MNDILQNHQGTLKNAFQIFWKYLAHELELLISGLCRVFCASSWSLLSSVIASKEKNRKINQAWPMVSPNPVAITKSQSSAMRCTLKLCSTRTDRVISATRISAKIRSQTLDRPPSFWHIKCHDRQTLVDDIMPYMAESLWNHNRYEGS